MVICPSQSGPLGLLEGIKCQRQPTDINPIYQEARIGGKIDFSLLEPTL
jgi:hypothetical protein